jgi:hypothetical protein
LTAHPLAVLSIGDGLCFASASLPYINHRSTTVNPFGLLTFDHCFSFAVNSFSTLTSILLSHLATLFHETYLLFQAKLLSRGKTYIFS